MGLTVKKTFRGVQVKKDALTIDIENGATIRIGNNSVHLTGDEMVRVEALFYRFSCPTDRDIASKVEDDLRRVSPPKTPIMEEGVVAQRMKENKEKAESAPAHRLENAAVAVDGSWLDDALEDTEELAVLEG